MSQAGSLVVAALLCLSVGPLLQGGAPVWAPVWAPVGLLSGLGLEPLWWLAVALQSVWALGFIFNTRVTKL